MLRDLGLKPIQSITPEQEAENNRLIKEVMRRRRMRENYPYLTGRMVRVDTRAPAIYPNGLVGKIVTRIGSQRLLQLQFSFPVFRGRRKITDRFNRCLVPEWWCDVPKGGRSASRSRHDSDGIPFQYRPRGSRVQSRGGSYLREVRASSE